MRRDASTSQLWLVPRLARHSASFHNDQDHYSPISHHVLLSAPVMKILTASKPAVPIYLRFTKQRFVLPGSPFFLIQCKLSLPNSALHQLRIIHADSILTSSTSLSHLSTGSFCRTLPISTSTNYN
ncbi:hypothetical protein CEXT_61461 [Caerostris extrusa]|uniref:Uncharacterized protein n=1 Tax=Caerostris extrusa TaxID=172846 RepID=A0AAV4MJN2_CAEEX|nr:hypothetical protein CEXT_61461 [Caerostris extrusa]